MSDADADNQRATDRRRELGTYLRSRDLDRLLQAVWQRFVQLGRAGGTVDVTPGEADILAGLLGRRPRGGRVALAALDAALQSSGFRTSLRVALETYFDRPLVSQPERTARQDAAWRRTLEELRAMAGPGTAAPPAPDPAPPAPNPAPPAPNPAITLAPALWVEADAGYLRREWRQHPAALVAAAQLVIRAIRALPAPNEPLAVFANRVAGDPHALDAGSLGGRLLLRALTQFHAETETVNGDEAPVEQRTALLAAAGLAVDDVSSTVLTAGLVSAELWLTAVRDQGLALALPLRSLAQVPDLAAWRQVAFVVENPSVFSSLLEALAQVAPGRRPTLICTSGQLSLAARRLLDALVSRGATILYSGDFDTSGINIARGLYGRYRERLRLWRMDVANYRTARTADTAETAAADIAPGPPDFLVPFAAPPVAATGIPGIPGTPGTAETLADLDPLVRREGAAYQEALLPLLVADLCSFALSGE